jgi:hypothetical protein
LFGLREGHDGGKLWAWPQIEEEAGHLGADDEANFNLRWIDQLKEVVAARRSGKEEDQPINRRYIGKDGKVYLPQVVIWRDRYNKEACIDIVFIPQLQDDWLMHADRPVALGANLYLATRIRHEVLDVFLKEINWWKGDELGRRKGFLRLLTSVDIAEHDGFIIKQLTQERMNGAFEGDDATRLGTLHADYRDNIGKTLHQTLGKESPDKDDVASVETALKDWLKNNDEFIDIGLKRYMKLLDQGSPEEGN